MLNNTENQTVSERLAYTVEEVSQLTTLSMSTLRNEIRAKSLRAIYAGWRRLILVDDLKNYLQKLGEKKK